jgi:hypothetical protein
MVSLDLVALIEEVEIEEKVATVVEKEEMVATVVVPIEEENN